MQSSLSEINVQATNSSGDETHGKYLTFWSASQLFGVSIADVEQIVGMQDITEVPDFPYYAKGIINLRGEIIPVIDVRLRLNKPEEEYGDRACIIVVSIHDKLFGFAVDSVEEVTDIEDNLISPPPLVSNDITGQYLIGVARLSEKIVLLIDTAKILGQSEFDALSGAIQ